MFITKGSNEGLSVLISLLSHFLIAKHPKAQSLHVTQIAMTCLYLPFLDLIKAFTTKEVSTEILQRAHEERYYPLREEDLSPLSCNMQFQPHIRIKLESPDKMSRPDKVQQIALFETRLYPTTHGRVVEAMTNQTDQELKLLLSVPGEFSRKFSTTHGSSWNRFEFNPPILAKVWDDLPKATSTENVTKGSPKSPPEGKNNVTILGLPMALVIDRIVPPTISTVSPDPSNELTIEKLILHGRFQVGGVLVESSFLSIEQRRFNNELHLELHGIETELMAKFLLVIVAQMPKRIAPLTSTNIRFQKDGLDTVTRLEKPTHNEAPPIPASKSEDRETPKRAFTQESKSSWKTLSITRKSKMTNEEIKALILSAAPTHLVSIYAQDKVMEALNKLRNRLALEATNMMAPTSF